MVVLEVGLNAAGLITGGQQATSVLNGLSTAASFAFTNVGKANTAMAAFGTRLAMSAGIFGAAATALGAISAALLLMGERTSKAAQEWDRLGAAMSKASARFSALSFVGADASSALDRQAQNQIDALAATYELGKPASARQLASASGIPVDRLLAVIAERGNREAAEFLKTGRFTSGFVTVPGEGTSTVYSSDLSELQVSIGQQRGVLGERYKQLALQTAARRGEMRGVPYAGGFGQAPDGFSMAETYPNMNPYEGVPVTGVMISPEEQRRVDAAIMAREMERVAQLSREIGDNLGDAVFDWVSGMRESREIMASILMDFGRSLAREGMANLTRTLISSFGATAAQSSTR